MTTPEKICSECGRQLRCTMTGAEAYLAHTGDTHSADLFCCFTCLQFRVFGLNMRPLVMWRDDPDRGRVNVTPQPDVVVAGGVIVTPYDQEHGFAYVEDGEVIPLPSAIRYMVEKCLHVEEIKRYLARASNLSRTGWRAKV